MVSPDQQISVQVRSENGKLYYVVNHRKVIVQEKSALGLMRDDANFAGKLTLIGIDKPTVVTDSYTSFRVVCFVTPGPTLFVQ